MKITTTTTSTVTFAVEDWWSEEGGMGEDTYGDQVDTLEEAIELLRSAQNTRVASYSWRIVAYVETKVSGEGGAK